MVGKRFGYVARGGNCLTAKSDVTMRVPRLRGTHQFAGICILDEHGLPVAADCVVHGRGRWSFGVSGQTAKRFWPVFCRIGGSRQLASGKVRTPISTSVVWRNRLVVCCISMEFMARENGDSWLRGSRGYASPNREQSKRDLI